MPLVLKSLVKCSWAENTVRRGYTSENIDEGAAKMESHPGKKKSYYTNIYGWDAEHNRP